MDVETLEIKLIDVEAILQDSNENEMSSETEKEIKNLQFSIVKGLNEEPNSVSFKCYNEIEDQILYMFYEDDEENS